LELRLRVGSIRPI